MEDFSTAFAVSTEAQLPFGSLITVALPQSANDERLAELLERSALMLPEAEQSLASALALPRRAAFIGGRLALRRALSVLAPSLAGAPLLRTPRGAPLLPMPMLGSVSHKRRLAAALVVERTAELHSLGVDIEDRPTAAESERPDLAPKILTPLERQLLNPLRADDAAAYREAVRLRFALKEAVYKAIDPHVQRYVRFQEVEVFPDPHGETHVRLTLPEFAGRSIVVKAWWQQIDDHILAAAAASPLE